MDPPVDEPPVLDVLLVVETTRLLMAWVSAVKTAGGGEEVDVGGALVGNSRMSR